MASRRSGRLVPRLPLAACAAAAALATLASAAPAAIAQSVPAPPAAAADRIGAYAWGIDYSAWPGTPDRLNWGAGFVAAAGSHTVRVYLGATDVYSVNPAIDPADDLYLQRIVATPGSAYDTLFANPDFQTYLLTVFTPGDAANWWRNGFTPKAAASEQNQIENLGAYLLANPRYAHKTFIICNWEGDNYAGANARPTAPAYPTAANWESFTAWVRSRAAGVAAARAAAPPTTARLYSALEFNLVNGPSGQRCGVGGEHCVIDRVAPYVDVDYYSYSSWQTINVKVAQPEASLAAQLTSDLGFALAAVRAGRPQVGPANFLIGEFGFARSQFGECTAATYLTETLEGILGRDTFQVSYAIFWQALDNRWRTADGASAVTACTDPDWMLYGLYRGRDLHQTLLGAAFADLLAGRRPDLPSGCPTINEDGVVNPAESYQPIFFPASSSAIFGRRFTGSDDAVWMVQGVSATQPNTLTEMASGVHGTDWYDSPHQIDATFPPGVLVAGCALVWMTAADQLESNAQIIQIQAPPLVAAATPEDR